MSTTAPVQGPSQNLLPILPSNGEPIKNLSPEDVIRQRLTAERARLEQEAGIEKREVQHFHKPIERPFTKLQRDHTTILFGGLTWKHERLVHARTRKPRLQVRIRAGANKKAFQLGKEYGNNGQCNPTLLHRREPGSVRARP